jgi:hypothetical protein
VTGRRKHRSFDATDSKGVAILEEAIELAAIGCQVPEIEHAFEGLLHGLDVSTDCRGSAERLFYIRRAAEVIRMHVRFKDPVNAELLIVYVGDDGIG